MWAFCILHWLAELPDFWGKALASSKLPAVFVAELEEVAGA